MGEALRHFFGSMGEFLGLGGSGGNAPQSPTVNGYTVDYSVVSTEEITARAPCADALDRGNWTPINRKS
jgi:hypothetical protein